MGEYYDAIRMIKQASKEDGFKTQDYIAGLLGASAGGHIGTTTGMALGHAFGKLKHVAGLGVLGGLTGTLAGGAGTANYAKKIRKDTDSKAGLADSLAMMVTPVAGGAAGALAGNTIAGLSGAKLLSKPGLLIRGLAMGAGGAAGTLAGTNLAARDWTDNE